VSPGALAAELLLAFFPAAEFLLQHSEPAAARLPTVAAALQDLHTTVQSAAAALLRDGHDPDALTVPATSLATSEESDLTTADDYDDGSTTASTTAAAASTASAATATGPLAACSEACKALARAECVLARGASLLHKLPRQWALCEALLTAAEGDDCEVKHCVLLLYICVYDTSYVQCACYYV
jgi:hypothetical protein